MGISKAYCTRVGAGPFPTELFDETGHNLCEIGHEYGATTGRPRRCGWIDIPALRYACMLNGVTDLFVTKPDVMNSFDEIKMCINYNINGETTEEIPFEFNEVEIKPQVLKASPTTMPFPKTCSTTSTPLKSPPVSMCWPYPSAPTERMSSLKGTNRQKRALINKYNHNSYNVLQKR